MDIGLDKVCELILRAREIDGKEGDTDPDSGSNSIDDGAADVLSDSEDDSTEEQVSEFLAGLNDDERLDLMTIVMIGRGDYEPGDWAGARQEARDNDDGTLATDLMDIPNLGDLLDEGLSALGRTCT